MSYYLVLVGTEDNPLYELEFGTYKQGGTGSAQFSAGQKQLNPFIIHSALDLVDEIKWSPPSNNSSLSSSSSSNSVSSLSLPLNIFSHSSTSSFTSHLPHHLHHATSMGGFSLQSSQLQNNNNNNNNNSNNNNSSSNNHININNNHHQQFVQIPPAPGSLYLKVVDRFNSYLISAFITPGNIKFMLLHQQKSEEPIRQFFADIYDLYVKTLMNPFYQVNDQIKSPVFDQKVKALIKKYL